MTETHVQLTPDNTSFTFFVDDVLDPSREPSLRAAMRDVFQVDHWPSPGALGPDEEPFDFFIRRRPRFHVVAAPSAQLGHPRVSQTIAGYVAGNPVPPDHRAASEWCAVHGVSSCQQLLEVGTLLVSPHFRGRRLANDLVKVSIQQILDVGYAPVAVAHRENTRSSRALESAGFQEVVVVKEGNDHWRCFAFRSN